jgi:hypothetical protein
MLYVSLDDHDSIWKAKIEEFKLSGNHLRANKMLQDTLSTLIWGAPEGYSIPHTYYLIETESFSMEIYLNLVLITNFARKLLNYLSEMRVSGTQHFNDAMLGSKG